MAVWHLPLHCPLAADPTGRQNCVSGRALSGRSFRVSSARTFRRVFGAIEVDGHTAQVGIEPRQHALARWLSSSLTMIVPRRGRAVDLDGLRAEFDERFPQQPSASAGSGFPDGQSDNGTSAFRPILFLLARIMSTTVGTSSHLACTAFRGAALPSAIDIAAISGFMKNASFAG